VWLTKMVKKFIIIWALSFWLPVSAQAATVLIYHHVSNTMPASTSISPERFIAQMDYLAKNNFKVVPLAELTEQLKQGDALPDKTVAITFDDSYADVYTAAYPILKKRGWPFTFFVNTDAVGSGKLFVTWDQLRDMAKHGVTIANHTTKHDHLVRLQKNETQDAWSARLLADINAAQKKIETEIGSAPKLFAYPYGEYNAAAKKIVKDLGYFAFTQQAGTLGAQTDLQTLPRFPFGGSYTDLPGFIEKVNTLPLPVKRIEFYAENKKPLGDMVLTAGTKPYLVLTLSDNSLLQKVRCFSSSEGAINVEVRNEQLWIQGTKILPAGRTKFTCTAASNQRGRFYWFAQLWLAADKNGDWTYKD
jgi:poly-beta-1,6-N-acetyl-D-glucosamine N-deacetylase